MNIVVHCCGSNINFYTRTLLENSTLVPGGNSCLNSTLVPGENSWLVPVSRPVSSCQYWSERLVLNGVFSTSRSPATSCVVFFLFSFSFPHGTDHHCIHNHTHSQSQESQKIHNHMIRLQISQKYINQNHRFHINKLKFHMNKKKFIIT